MIKPKDVNDEQVFSFNPDIIKHGAMKGSESNRIIIPKNSIPGCAPQKEYLVLILNTFSDSFLNRKFFPIVFTEYANVDLYLLPSSGETVAKKVFVNSKVLGASLPKQSPKESTPMKSDIFYIVQNKNVCKLFNF